MIVQSLNTYIMRIIRKLFNKIVLSNKHDIFIIVMIFFCFEHLNCFPLHLFENVYWDKLNSVMFNTK